MSDDDTSDEELFGGIGAITGSGTTGKRTREAPARLMDEQAVAEETDEFDLEAMLKKSKNATKKLKAQGYDSKADVLKELSAMGEIDDSFIKEKPKQFDQAPGPIDGEEDGLDVDGISMADGDTKKKVANKLVGARAVLEKQPCWMSVPDLRFNAAAAKREIRSHKGALTKLYNGLGVEWSVEHLSALLHDERLSAYFIGRNNPRCPPAMWDWLFDLAMFYPLPKVVEGATNTLRAIVAGVSAEEAEDVPATVTSSNTTTSSSSGQTDDGWKPFSYERVLKFAVAHGIFPLAENPAHWGCPPAGLGGAGAANDESEGETQGGVESGEGGAGSDCHQASSSASSSAASAAAADAFSCSSSSNSSVTGKDGAYNYEPTRDNWKKLSETELVEARYQGASVVSFLTLAADCLERGRHSLSAKEVLNLMLIGSIISIDPHAHATLHLRTARQRLQSVAADLLPSSIWPVVAAERFSELVLAWSSIDTQFLMLRETPATPRWRVLMGAATVELTRECFPSVVPAYSDVEEAGAGVGPEIEQGGEAGGEVEAETEAEAEAQPEGAGGQGAGNNRALSEQRIIRHVVKTVENMLGALPPCSNGHGELLRGKDDVASWHESAGLIDLLITSARARSTVSRDTYRAIQRFLEEGSDSVRMSLNDTVQRFKEFTTILGAKYKPMAEQGVNKQGTMNSFVMRQAAPVR